MHHLPQVHLHSCDRQAEIFPAVLKLSVQENLGTRQFLIFAPLFRLNQLKRPTHGRILALHYEARFLRHAGSIEHALTGFDNILARYGAHARLPG